MHIETGIPTPGPRWQWRTFAEMKVGDSIFIVDGKQAYRTANNARTWAKAAKNGAKFRARMVDGGTRIWRIA